jgi:hypothetical protein
MNRRHLAAHDGNAELSEDLVQSGQVIGMRDFIKPWLSRLEILLSLSCDCLDRALEEYGT